jgi:hypothetical protein
MAVVLEVAVHLEVAEAVAVVAVPDLPDLVEDNFKLTIENT